MSVTELAIVGAGPAGVAAALWAHTLQLERRVLERHDVIGGQLGIVLFHPIEVPGIASATGPEMARAYAEQLAALGILVETGVAARGLSRKRVR